MSQKNKSLKPIFLLALLGLSACSDGYWWDMDKKKSTPESAAAPVADGASAQFMKEWLEKAKKEELRGDFFAQTQTYDVILRQSPDNIDVRLAQANAFRRLGEYDKAFGLYADLLKQDATLLSAKEGGAITLISKGDYVQPVALLEEVIKADAKRPLALNAMGVLFTTRDLQTDAQVYFAEALKYSPDDPALMHNMALSKALQGRYDQALTMLSDASARTAAGSYERKRIDMNSAIVHAASGHPEDALAIAGAYYGGSSYTSAFGIYAKLAANKKLASQYLHAALADGRTYYEQGWDNLSASNAR